MLTQNPDVVFITGASSGIGEACARLYAKDGVALVLLARREDRLKELKNSLAGVEVHTVVADVGDRAAVDRAVAELPERFKNVTVLVNAAGLALGLEPGHKANMADWEQMIQTNVNGLVYCTHALLQGMVARNRGHIVNLGSVAGTYPYPGGNVYGATKAFLHQFTLNLRAEVLGSQIRLTSIEPGMVETEFALVRFKGDAEKAKNVYAGMKPLTAHDIADTIHWCTTRPPHVNINTLEVMPVMQAFGPFAVKRD
jgi:3-hydroxy acid dehydrogenase/malonic semialdehyde reductase